MNTVYKIILFIVVLTVILMMASKNITMGAAIIAIIANIFVLYKHFALGEDDTSNTSNTSNGDVPEISENFLEDQQGMVSDGDNSYLYSQDMQDYESYKKDYTMKDSSRFGGNNANDSAVNYVLNRGDRSKESMDGHVLKDVNFYKYHFEDELGQMERKVWWGQYEN